MALLSCLDLSTDSDENFMSNYRLQQDVSFVLDYFLAVVLQICLVDYLITINIYKIYNFNP